MTVPEGEGSPDPKLPWLRFYCLRHMDLLPVYEYDPATGSCACGRPECRERDWGKHPRINWGADATSNLALVEGWHRRWPTANWAWALKHHFVVDLDPRNGGWTADELYEAWGNTLGFELPATLRADTGGGGTHLVFEQPEGEPIRNGKLVLPNGRPLPGVDVKGAGGYVLVHPSNHKAGAWYMWHDGWVDPAEPPPELLECVRRRALSVARAQERDEATERVEREAAGGFDIDEWLAEAAQVPPGYQHDHLVRGLGWMRARGRSSNEMVVAACSVVDSFTNGDPANPWTHEHAMELVADIRNRYAANVSGSVVIPQYTPHASGAPAGGDGGDGGEDNVTPIDAGGGGDDEFRLTHVWLKERFLELHRDVVRWTDAEGWHIWMGDRWMADQHEVHRRYELLILKLQEDVQHAGLDAQQLNPILRTLDRWLAMGPMKSLEELTRKDITIPAEDFDQHPHLLNCPNGTVDLRTGELTPHDRTHLLTRMTAAEYEPGARSPLLDHFYDTFMPDPEHQAALFRILGMCLVGGNPYRIFPMFIGRTSTGKTQLIEAVRRVLASYAGVGGPNVLRGQLDDKPRPDLLGLFPRRIAILEEASKVWDLHADQVKRVTGETANSARTMNAKVYVTRVPDFTPLVVANTTPRINDADDAVKRRLVVAPFLRSVVADDDPSFAEAFKADTGVHRALLARMVKGAAEVIAGNGLGDLPPAFIEATMRAFEGMDDVTEFLGSMFEDGQLIIDREVPMSHCVGIKDLHGMYQMWITMHGDADQKRHRQGLKEFAQRIQSLGWEVKKSGPARRMVGVVKRSFSVLGGPSL